MLTALNFLNIIEDVVDKEIDGRGGGNNNNSNYRVDRSGGNNNTNDDDTNSDTSTLTNVAPDSILKYIHPSDKDQTVEANGITFKFCAKYTYHKNV